MTCTVLTTLRAKGGCSASVCKHTQMPAHKLYHNRDGLNRAASQNNQGYLLSQSQPMLNDTSIANPISKPKPPSKQAVPSYSLVIGKLPSRLNIMRTSLLHCPGKQSNSTFVFQRISASLLPCKLAFNFHSFPDMIPKCVQTSGL